MTRVLQFIAWVWNIVWRIGVRVASAVVNWARQNWPIVLKWLERGVSFWTILDWIRHILGI